MIWCVEMCRLVYNPMVSTKCTWPLYAVVVVGFSVAVVTSSKQTKHCHWQYDYLHDAANKNNGVFGILSTVYLPLFGVCVAILSLVYAVTQLISLITTSKAAAIPLATPRSCLVIVCTGGLY